MIDEWIDIDEEKPSENQQCRVLFDDGTESTGQYLAGLGIFALNGPLTSFLPQVVTHWMDAEYKRNLIMIKIGDKKAVVKMTGDRKKDVLAIFDQMEEEQEEKKLIELQQKKREINERAKSRF